MRSKELIEFNLIPLMYSKELVDSSYLLSSLSVSQTKIAKQFFVDLHGFQPLYLNSDDNSSYKDSDCREILQCFHFSDFFQLNY